MVNQSQFIEMFGTSFSTKATIPLSEMVQEDRPITYGVIKPGDFVDEGVVLIRVKDIVDGKIVLANLRRITNSVAQNYMRSTLCPGDILLSIRGTIGRTAIVPKKLNGANITQDTARIALKEAYNNHFIKCVLDSPVIQEWIQLHVKGLAVKGINLEDVRKIPIPAVDENLQEKYIKLYHHADKSKFAGFKSQFIEMFGDLSTNSTNINITTIDELFDVGSSKRVFEKDWTTSGVPFYRAREIVKLAKDGFVDNELFITESMYSEYAEKYGIPAPGDIMVTGVGTLGVCYLVKEGDRFYYKDGNTLCFHSLGKIDSRFVVECYKMPFVINQIEGRADFTTVGTYTIEKARKTRIPWPSKEQQKKFLSVVYQADKSKYLN